MDEFGLKDYLSILRRRKKYFFISALVIFLLSVAFASHWANYRSVATIEVAPAQISANTTKPQGMTTSDYNESLANLRISHLQQKVLSTASLIEIITKFNLYSDARRAAPIAEVAENMLAKIKVELINSTLASASGMPKNSADELSATVFTVSFDYGNPLLSQQVTNELASRFLDEDLKDRRNSAHETSLFLDAQIKALEASMDEQEKKIADFRSANKGSQPESLAFNQQAAQSVQFNIQSIESQITANEGTQGNLRGQIATVDPYSRLISDGQVLTTPSVQLKALKAQYATLTAQYGAEHPDVIKIRHQIQALQQQVSGSHSANIGDLEARISDTRTNLEAAQKTYGPDHPDVTALQHKLSRLEKQRADLKKNPGAEDGIRQDADNPAYLEVVAQLKAAEEQHKSLLEQKDSLMSQQEKFQNAISENPVAEQKLAALTRDYENSQLRYRELKEKKMTADMSETIEQDRSGQRLVIVNPPELPLHTHPARMVLLLGGLALALAGGLISVALAQIASQSIVGAHHLESLIGVAPLVTIPHIVTSAEMNSLERKKLKSAGIFIVSLIVAAIIFSYAIMPLDVLWATLIQKLGLN